MRFLSFAIFLLIMNSLKASERELIKDAKTFVKNSLSSYRVDPQDFVSVDEKGKEFDPAEAKKNLKEGKDPDNEVFNFAMSDEVSENQKNKHFDEDEWFIRRSEEIATNKETEYEEEGVYSLEKCRKGGDPYSISLTRTLNLDIVYETEDVKVCTGHELTNKYKTKKEAHKRAKKKSKKISKDPQVTFCDYDIQEVKSKYKYRVTWRWAHCDNVVTCDSYRNETRAKPDKFEIANEQWTFDDTKYLALSRTPQCTLIDQTCVDANQKIVNGQEIRRKCWKERLSFLCISDQKNECTFLKSKNCDEISRKCLKEGPLGCSLWELTFRCLSGIKRTQKQTDNEEIIGLKEDLWDTEYEINDSFAEVSTKLAVFEQIKNEISSTQVLDATKIDVFSGKKEKCEKSISSDLMYDCCFSLSGLATKLKLTHCSSDELALAEKRERGFCHYVGKKEEKTLGVKTKDVHVFCCFSSKLSKIFQEQARKQMNIGWGTAKHPNCAGLKIDEISSLDFSKLDLSEVYEESFKKTENLEQKLENFKNRLVESLEEELKA